MLCHDAECRILLIMMPSVIMLGVIMLNVVMLTIVMLSVVSPYTVLHYSTFKQHTNIKNLSLTNTLAFFGGGEGAMYVTTNFL
jgi:hypothetical protein